LTKISQSYSEKSNVTFLWFTVYDFHGTTMTIMGILLTATSIATVKQFLVQRVAVSRNL